MDSGEAAQLAAIAGALGAAFVLLGRGRLLILPGLALLALGELGLVHDLSGNRVSTKLAALGVASLIPMAIGAAVLVRWPALVTPLIAVAAPFRPPLSFGSEHRYYVGVASSGQLGRLLPLYAVLGAAALALAWKVAARTPDAARDAASSRFPRSPSWRISAISLLWTDDLHVRRERPRLLPAALRDCSSRSSRARRSRPWLPRALAVIAVGARHRCSRSSG